MAGNDAITYCESRLLSLRVSRYSWWTHWRELADYFLPRRYKWLITTNQASRGSPINQHILDSTGVLAARNCASGLLSGKSSPTRPWFKLRLGMLDATGNTPQSLWLAEAERLMALVFNESNFYNAIATFYYDMVIFGTAAMLIYEDYNDVILCFNPCAGEYYIDIDGNYRPVIFCREFTMTISAAVARFGIENMSDSVKRIYAEPNGTNLAKEIIIAHIIEPNNDGRARIFGVSDRFKYRECYWEWSNSASPQSAPIARKPLEARGYNEQCAIVGRWDIVSNDPYGRSPAMDALGDQKQLQIETRRKAQAIDKMINPPMNADVQMKNQPASLLPGAINYISGFSQSGKPAFSPVYEMKFPVAEITEDLNEVRDRLRRTFFNDLFQTISQFETRSNVTAAEIDARKAESLVMLGPVLERIDNEVLGPVIERVFGIMARAGIFPPAPPELSGQSLTVEFVSILAQAQQAAQSAGIDRILGIAGHLAGIRPDVMDKINTDFALDKYNTLMQNDPRIINSDAAVAQIRQSRERQQQMAQNAEIADKLSKGARNLADVDVGGGMNAVQAMIGGQ